MDQEAQIPPEGRGDSRRVSSRRKKWPQWTVRRDVHWLWLGMSKSKTEAGNEGPAESTQNSSLSSIGKSQ